MFDPSSCPGPGSRVAVAFVIEADAEPGLLLRLLHPFARRHVIPDCVRAECQGDVMAVEIAVAAISPEDAHLTAGNLRQVVGVRSVAENGRESVRRAA